MENKLKDYTSGKISYTPIMNFLINNREKDWYGELGKYLVKTIDIDRIPELSFYSDKIKGFKTKVKDFIGIERVYSSIAIYFLTSVLDDNALRKIFGEPLFHDEFGEGFDGEFDEELDDYLEPDIKESYASYFVTINNVDVHIGYDHRGTNIEIKIDNKPETVKNKLDYMPSLKDTTLVFETLKELVNLYKQKCI